MATNGTIEVREADLADPTQQAMVIDLINQYAQEPMGGGEPLPATTANILGDELAKFPGTFVALAWKGETPVGMAVCFRGFSTFAAKPLINVHDLFVHPSVRGMGVGKLLLDAVERHAKELGCVKLTLEVLEGNDRARHVYRNFGFEEAPFAEQKLMFLAKKLS